MALLPTRAAESAPPSLEYQVKAAFLLNFAHFTEWPPSAFESPASPLRICIAGPNPFEGALAGTLQGESVDGHPLVIEQLDMRQRPTSCQMLFVSRTAGSFGVEATRAAAEAPTLTIAESDVLWRDGGAIINFIIDAGHVRFDISQTVAERRGLRLSSKLLRVARMVQ